MPSRFYPLKLENGFWVVIDRLTRKPVVGVSDLSESGANGFSAFMNKLNNLPEKLDEQIVTDLFKKYIEQNQPTQNVEYEAEYENEEFNM